MATVSVVKNAQDFILETQNKKHYATTEYLFEERVESF